MKTPARTMLESLGRELSPEAEQALNEALESARFGYEVRSGAKRSRGDAFRDLDTVAKRAGMLAKALMSEHVKDRLEVSLDGYGILYPEILAPLLEALARAATAAADPIRDYSAPDWPNALTVLLGRDLPQIAKVHLGIDGHFSRDDEDRPCGPLIDAVKAAVEALGARTSTGGIPTAETIGTYISDARKALAPLGLDRP